MLSRTHPYSVTCSRQTFLISIPCSLPQKTPNKLSELSSAAFMCPLLNIVNFLLFDFFLFCFSFLVKPVLILKEAELRLVTELYGVAQKLEKGSVLVKMKILTQWPMKNGRNEWISGTVLSERVAFDWITSRMHLLVKVFKLCWQIMLLLAVWPPKGVWSTTRNKTLTVIGYPTPNSCQLAITPQLK